MLSPAKCVGGAADDPLKYGAGLLQVRRAPGQLRVFWEPDPGERWGAERVGTRTPNNSPGFWEPRPGNARGFLQVHKAFEYLERAAAVDTPDARYAATVTTPAAAVPSRGIYLREAAELARPSSHTVTLTPHLHRTADVRAEKLAVEDRLLLRTRNSSSWLDTPDVLLLPHNGRGFDVRIDATALPPGLHYDEVEAWDAAAEWRGPLARVPVAVCKPHVLPAQAGLPSAAGCARWLSYSERI